MRRDEEMQEDEKMNEIFDDNQEENPKEEESQRISALKSYRTIKKCQLATPHGTDKKRECIKTMLHCRQRSYFGIESITIGISSYVSIKKVFTRLFKFARLDVKFSIFPTLCFFKPIIAPSSRAKVSLVLSKCFDTEQSQINRLLAFFLPTNNAGDKNILKELGLNPGPFVQLMFPLTTKPPRVCRNFVALACHYSQYQIGSINIFKTLSTFL